MKKQWKIKKDVLQTIMDFSKASYPNEFSGFLYVDDYVINDLYILPATKNYRHSTVIRLDLAPMLLNLNGSVHSHPSGFGLPSKADIHFFSNKMINIITFHPFSLNDFKAYDKEGNLVFLKII